MKLLISCLSNFHLLDLISTDLIKRDYSSENLANTIEFYSKISQPILNDVIY